MKGDLCWESYIRKIKRPHIFNKIDGLLFSLSNGFEMEPHTVKYGIFFSILPFFVSFFNNVCHLSIFKLQNLLLNYVVSEIFLNQILKYFFMVR